MNGCSVKRMRDLFLDQSTLQGFVVSKTEGPVLEKKPQNM